MRRILFAVVAFLFVALFLAPRGLCWAGNVLLPSSNSNSSGGLAHAPNLGLSPPPPVQSNVPSSKKNQALVKDLPLPTPPTPVQKSVSLTPTQIIQRTDMSGIVAQKNKNLPNELTISMSKTSSFGAKDLSEISTKLGLSRSQVVSSCLPSVEGTLQTDKGEFEIYGGLSQQVSVRYEGRITNYRMSARAICQTSKLPADSGPLIKINNRFIIPLQQVACLPPTGRVYSMTISYDGSGVSQCVYE